jgi:predicted DNA-binding transcriptional regulator AlpA
MKIFAIRDETDKEQKNLAYLLYYEMEKLFYIELPEKADPWETPLLLSSFAKRGEKTVNSYWSKLWVQQRIIPTDRQNLGQVLKENGLKEYDEYSLLMLSMGRCAQDDYYLVPIEDGGLPEEIKNRFFMRIEDVVPLEDYHLLVFFRDGKVKKCSLRDRLQSENAFRVLLRDEKLFCHVQMQTGGYGVAWDTNMTISDAELYRIGQDVPLSAEDFKNFVVHRVVTAAEAAEILDCSRQNIDDLTKRGKLHPIKIGTRTTLFLKSEILKRNWQ